MEDLTAAMATIALTAIVLVTLLLNADSLDALFSKIEQPTIQTAQGQLTLPIPDPRRTGSR